jgi:hypothetical protein
MATRFKSLLFKYLPNAAHYNFCLHVQATIEASPEVVTSRIGGLADAFAALFAEENELRVRVRKNVLTPEIAAANHTMNFALTAFRAIVRSMRSIPEESIADTAVHVYTMLMSYGNVNAKPYEEQSGKVKSILSQVGDDGAYHHDINVLKSKAAVVENMITDLQNAFDSFTGLLAKRDVESLRKPKRPFPQVRRDIEAVYHKIAAIINASALLGESPAFDDFINSLNPEIERLNAEFHRVRTRLDSAHTTIETIPMQPYTEKPVTPLPRVFFQTGKETLELELGKDFSVTYRNNNCAGMAQLTVHGKGKYKGSKTTTFMIAW